MALCFTLRLFRFAAALLWNACGFVGLLLRHCGTPPLASRARWLQRSSQRLLRALNVELNVSGIPPNHGLLVSNHLSYLDIPVFAAILPVVFVAKAEVRGWPAFGWFARRAGTIFLRRTRRLDVERVNREMNAALLAGQVVMLFPEGTSSDGRQVLPFRSSLLEPATGSGCVVHAAAVDYTLDDGNVEEDVCYFGEMTLLPHLLKMMRKRRVRAFVGFGAAEPGNADRKQLARQLHADVFRLRQLSAAQRGGRPPEQPAAATPLD